MIIYIHGFGGSGQGNKAKEFRNYFKSLGIGFVAPSLPYNPELAITTLDELIDSYKDDVYLIGSSLGGFYSIYLSQKQNVKKVVLINPAITPWNTLQRAKGLAPNFYDESTFAWCESHLEILKKYEIKDIDKQKIFLLVQKGDELLDYTQAVDKLKNAKTVIEDGGNHAFEGIDRYFEEIKYFLN
ncbi:MAG: YqiA/YcfP family alpha/beta fold hydrolase [Arcobacteraceae bacterium]